MFRALGFRCARGRSRFGRRAERRRQDLAAAIDRGISASRVRRDRAHHHVDGKTIGDGEERRIFIGWFGHQDGVKPQLTPRETLRFYSRYYGMTGDIAAALAEVGLSRARDLPAQHLSVGQKKRVALARLKLSGRPLWLLDEPLASLDIAGKSLAAAIYRRSLPQPAASLIAATHEPLGINCMKLVLGDAP